ncbi:MAG: alkaline phosphatase [Muribaculaceae bacterium]|nr:alkaline phosphatase [Muribaculaceae bacterium]
MKKFFSIVTFCLLCVLSAAAQPKYVFYFIGDGMGLNQINITELYLASLKGNIGIEHLAFADLPYATFANSFSASSDVTDSAAAGTALATGNKTNNSMLGVTPDNTPVNSIALWAKNSGKKVGICTNVNIDDATPGAFYAHQANRGSYNAIGRQLAASGYDYFAGSDFRHPKGDDGTDLHQICADNGYTWAYGYEEGKAKCKEADKLIMVQRKDAKRDIPYTIDRDANDLTMSQIVEVGINTLMKNNKNGFFFMVEGGAIDHACHGRDAATVIQDVLDFDESIKVALEFYKQHPKETLIVVTADHETGGMVPGNGPYSLNLKVLQYQTCSTDMVTEKLNILKKNRMRKTWEDIKSVLSESYGLFTEVPVSWRDEVTLFEAYEAAFNGDAKEENWYSVNSALATKARDILNKTAGVSWASGSHSGGHVPVFAIGVGADQFHCRLDNTQIPEVTARVAKYKK